MRISLRIVLKGLPSRARDFSFGKVPRPQGTLIHTNEKRKSFYRTGGKKKKNQSPTGFSIFTLKAVMDIFFLGLQWTGDAYAEVFAMILFLITDCVCHVNIHNLSYPHTPQKNLGVINYSRQ